MRGGEPSHADLHIGHGHPSWRYCRDDDGSNLYAHEGIPLRPESVLALDTLLANPALGHAYLIEDESGPVGYLILIYSFSIEHAGHTALLDELYISASSRGKGLCKAAVQFAIATARDADCRILYLEVSEENLSARQLYTKAGFHPLPRSMQRWAAPL